MADTLIDVAETYMRDLEFKVAAQKEVIEIFTDAAIQALAYIASPAKDDYQLSLVKQKAETKLRSALELAGKAQARAESEIETQGNSQGVR